MSQTGRPGPDFNLPDEILAVIPTDPYDQLDVARKITSMAITSRVSKLESEVGRLRQKVYDKDRYILELEDKLGHLEQAYHDANERLKIARDDNMKLSKERDSLAITAKRFSRDLAKLETFKRQLVQSLSDDSSQVETVDIETYDQSIPKAYVSKDEEVNGYSSIHRSFSSSESGYTTDDAMKQDGQRLSITPYLTQRHTPSGTPRSMSTTGSPRLASGATSPDKFQYDGHGVTSSWYSSSQQSSAANSPPRCRPIPVRILSRTPRIDGKEFFRRARSRLSYEQFGAFLSNIKEFNAKKQSKEETLRNAEELFGTENRDLYLSFQGLLNHRRTN